MTPTKEQREIVISECIRAHNAGHDALCLTELAVCSIARSDLESLMTIAKMHGEQLRALLSAPEQESVTIGDFVGMVEGCFISNTYAETRAAIHDAIKNNNLRIIRAEQGEK